jgi:hypothetical protein
MNAVVQFPDMTAEAEVKLLREHQYLNWDATRLRERIPSLRAQLRGSQAELKKIEERLKALEPVLNEFERRRIVATHRKQQHEGKVP